MLEIIYHDVVTSTHLELIEALKNNVLKPPVAFVANMQRSGIGTRDNIWQSLEGNLFLSFAIYKSRLPSDLAISSASIYFSYIMKEILEAFGSEVFLKWPNDFYVQDKKIGGVITKLLKGDIVVCSMGINLKKAPYTFGKLDITIERDRLIKDYFLKLKEDILWKYIFRKYQVEFNKSKSFTYYDLMANKKISLKNAELHKDGSIELNGRKVYSLR